MPPVTSILIPFKMGVKFKIISVIRFASSSVETRKSTCASAYSGTTFVPLPPVNVPTFTVVPFS